jgi:hypothetical protein
MHVKGEKSLEILNIKDLMIIDGLVIQMNDEVQIVGKKYYIAVIQ